MTAPSVTGSIVDIQSANASGSQSVTVPADADLCLVLAAYWDSGSNPDFSSLTIGGNAFTPIARAGSGTYNYSTAWRRNSPPAGSQTLAWTWSNGALSEGGHIYVVFLRDVDVSGDPVRGSSTDGSGSTNQTLTTGSFSTDPNDLALVIASSYQNGSSNDINVDLAGQTALIEDTAGYNDTSGAIGSKAGVSGTTTMSAYGDYPSCIGLSIKGTTGGTEYNQSAAGTLEFTGAQARRAGKLTGGAAVFSGALIRQAGKVMSGAIGIAGLLLRQGQKAVSGALSLAGSLSGSFTRTIGLDGAVTFAGSAVRQAQKAVAGAAGSAGSITTITGKALSGAAGFIGQMVRSVQIGIAGAAGFEGALAAVKTILLSIGGALEYSGSLVRQTGKLAGGALTFAGGLVRQAQTSMSGALNLTGTQTRRAGKLAAGAVSAAGALAADLIAGAFQQAVGGVVSLAGALSHSTGKGLAGTLTFSSSLARRTAKMLTGLLASAGALVRQIVGLPTPAGRTLIVPAETRALIILAESRTLIAAETRALIVLAESRTLIVPAETRVYAIGE